MHPFNTYFLCFTRCLAHTLLLLVLSWACDQLLEDHSYENRLVDSCRLDPLAWLCRWDAVHF
jgi:phosphatidylinositol glycan class V